jgi:hypothetical protein
MRRLWVVKVTSGGTSSASAGELRKRLFQLIGAGKLEWHERDCRLGRRSLCLAPLRYVQGVSHVDERGKARQTRQQCAHEIDLLRGQFRGEIGEAGDVAARMRKALY